MYAKAKASRLENDLANTFWSLGYAVIRGPSSGAGVSKRYSPDLLAIKDGIILVFEIKSKRKSGSLYIDSSQILGLQEFAKRAKGIPIIAFKSRGKEWKFHFLNNLESTGKNFKLNSPDDGLKLRDLEELFFRKHKDLNEYLL
ncbi:MAG: Holliday junction resolvase [Caldisphaera sp.]|jgi:Holliday junction resolvase|nr:MAG: Holliday junction resolvase [Caldisphaera sp.]PMP87816.1 MAG: Holliday junction resolvase [Caldisphaera sp.]